MEQRGESSRSRLVFRKNDGSAMRIWLDPKLPNLSSLVHLIQANGAQVSTTHDDPSIRLLILHPSSINIFDRYCHPVWLSPEGRERRKEAIQAGERDEEEWRRKVILTGNWPRLCITAGKVLEEQDNWGGCRKGGPPVIIRKPSPVPIPIESATTRQSQISPVSSPVIHLPPSPISPPPEPVPPPTVSDNPEPKTQNIQSFVPRTQNRPANLGFPPTILERAPIPDYAEITQQGDKGPEDVRPLWQGKVVVSDEKTAGQAGPRWAVSPIRSQSPSYPKPPTTNPTLSWCPSKKVSAWQDNGNIPPPTIFNGLRFFVSTGRTGRKQTVKYLRQSGGTEVTDIKFATHALLAPVSAKEEKKLIGVMQWATGNGIWSLPFEWVEACWDAGKPLPEASWAYVGGIPTNSISNRPAPNRPTQTIPPTVPRSISSTAPTPTQIGPPSTPTHELDRLIRNAHPQSLIRGATQNTVAKKLHESNPQYSELTWLAMYKNWLKYAGPFKPTAEDDKYKTYSGYFPPLMPGVQFSGSLEGVSNLLARDNPRLGLTANEWNQHFGNWLRAGGQYGLSKPLPPHMSTTPANTPAQPRAMMQLPSKSAVIPIPLPQKQYVAPKPDLPVPAKPQQVGNQPVLPLPARSASQPEAIPLILHPLTPPLPKSIVPEVTRLRLNIPIPPESTPIPLVEVPPKPPTLVLATKISKPPPAMPQIHTPSPAGPQPKIQTIPCPPLPAAPSEPSSPELELPPTLKRDVIARMFKLNFNSERHSSKHVAECLTGMTSQTVHTLQKVYRAWRAGAAPFNGDLPPDLIYTNDGKIAITRLASQTDLDPQSHSTKRVRST